VRLGCAGVERAGGGAQVCIRKRPLSDKEVAAGESDVVRIGPASSVGGGGMAGSLTMLEHKARHSPRRRRSEWEREGEKERGREEKEGVKGSGRERRREGGRENDSERDKERQREGGRENKRGSRRCGRKRRAGSHGRIRVAAGLCRRCAAEWEVSDVVCTVQGGERHERGKVTET
jgi:hypothetical protein